jgi:hypothetical protein
MAQLKKIEDRVQALKDELDFTMNEKNELYKKIRDCEIKLNRSLEVSSLLTS